MGFKVKPARRIKGVICLPGDKSIAHRAAIISAISPGKTAIKNFPANKDCLYTVEALKKLGIRIDGGSSGAILVYGKGLRGLKEPAGPVFVGDSGTTFRLLCGLLAGQDFTAKLTAGKSLSYRPMLRVTAPLRMMGAAIKARAMPGIREEYPPLTIKGGGLKAITYALPVASAQVKSAILFAGLYAQGATRVIEPVRTRDHTERMLGLFGADIKTEQNKVVISPRRGLRHVPRVYVPADMSSAGFFTVLCSLLKDSELVIKGVSLNPFRTGIITVLRRMGADIRIKRAAASYEPMGDLTVRSSSLRGTVVESSDIPSLIDELPVLMVAACLARGVSVFKGVQELRLKETDRIKSMSENLIKMGADITIAKGGRFEAMTIRGVRELSGIKARSYGDHRTAMSMVIAGLLSRGNTVIDDVECVSKSFPGFLGALKSSLQYDISNLA